MCFPWPGNQLIAFGFFLFTVHRSLLTVHCSRLTAKPMTAVNKKFPWCFQDVSIAKVNINDDLVFSVHCSLFTVHCPGHPASACLQTP